jgi:hypothetical protein
LNPGGGIGTPLGVLPGDGDISNIKTLDKRPQFEVLHKKIKTNLRLNQNKKIKINI